MLLPLLLPLLWGLGALHGTDSCLPAGSLAWYPRYRLHMPKSVSVQEGLCVLVPCQFYYHRFPSMPGSFTGSWFREESGSLPNPVVATNNPQQQVQKETQDRFHLLWDTQTRNCSLHIRDAQRADGGLYSFHMNPGSSRRNFYWNQVTVYVTALYHIPDILMLGTLESGCPNNLTCSVPWACEQGTPPIFSWMGVSVSYLDSTITSSSVLTLSPRPQDHGTNLTCQVMFPGAGVTVERTIQLNITCENCTSKPRSQGVRGVTGKSGPMAEVMLVTLVEMAVKILLLGLCLTFLRMRYQRKKVERPNIVLDAAMS
uniref:Ig-like domain-containing protein n=1 Tax=Cavia porcellus TaxID=10141 RepID=H0W6U4_CAVPO